MGDQPTPFRPAARQPRSHEIQCPRQRSEVARLRTARRV